MIDFHAFSDELQKIASLGSVRLADEAMPLIRKAFPKMTVGESAARATQVGREGRPSVVRRALNAFSGDRSGSVRSELSRKTPGKYDIATSQKTNPDVWNPAAGRKSTFVERAKAHMRRGDDPEGLVGRNLVNAT